MWWLPKCWGTDIISQLYNYREPRNILQTCIVWSRNLNILCTYRYIVPFCFHWPPTITVYRVLIVVLFDFWQKVPYFGGGGVARSAKTKSLGGTFCTIWGGPPENFENQKVQWVLFVQRVVVSRKNRKNKKYHHFRPLCQHFVPSPPPACAA